MAETTFSGFSIVVDGRFAVDHQDFEVIRDPVAGEGVARGPVTRRTVYRHKSLGIEVMRFIRTFPGLRLVEGWIELRNASDREVRVSRVDSVRGVLPADEYMLRYFTSDWGQEFTPKEARLEGTRILEVTSGRSSKGMHPWFELEGRDGHAIVGAVAWSGNWIVRFESAGSTHVLTAGLSDWQFEKVLRPGEMMEAPHVLYVSLPGGNASAAAIDFGRWGRRYGYAKNALARTMPVEWNHWWPYEDAEIDEKVFQANAAEAAKLGIEVCTLDAGWFGGGSVGQTNWYEVRGDWNRVNPARFPAGLAALSADVRGRGMKFGLWCEIEAVGKNAELAKAHPELLAKREGRPIGYVCLGNPAAVDWAFGTLDRLIREYQLSWIKLDFNVDPGAGCDRADHGHGPGDGLYEHYRGYYRLLDRVRAAHPDVMLEACSSGGLRIDLGILQHLHAIFLSDPDYTEHALQLLWGATRMLHPSVLLRWAWSQTRPAFGQNRVVDPYTADTPMSKFDYMVRAAMIGIMGYSWRLPDLPAKFQERLREHIGFYKQHVRDLLRDGDLYALTNQALRTGKGDRWNAFVTVAEDKRSAVLLVFRLVGGEEARSIVLKGLDPTLTYEASLQDKRVSFHRSGIQLMNEGLRFEDIPPEGSEVILLRAR